MKKMASTLMALIAVSTVLFADIQLQMQNIKTPEASYSFGAAMKQCGQPIDICNGKPFEDSCKKGWQEQPNYIVPRFLPLINDK